MGDMVGTAHYGLASKLVDSLSLLSSSVLTAIFPFFSAKWVESEVEVKKGLLYAAKFFLVVGMISAIGVTVDARELIAMMFGVQFAGMRATLVVLIWSFFCYMAGAPLGVIILVDKDRLAKFLPYIPAVLAMNILLNLWLIPRYSYFGASVSTLVCSVVIYVIKVRLVRALLPSWKDLLRISWRPVVAAFSMTVVLLFTRQGPFPVSATCGAVAFVGVLYYLGEFASAEYAGFHAEPSVRVGGGAWTNGRSGPVEE
jgi:O-antigen/teichoic acid export membrane protein